MKQKTPEIRTSGTKLRPEGKSSKFAPELTNDEDPVFLTVVTKVISGLFKNNQPEEVHIIKIKNWFDHKWLHFSGKGRVNFDSDFPSDPGVALDEFFSDKTFPPFSPKRILDERIWVRSERGNRPVWKIHAAYRERSCWNLHRRVSDHSRSGVFLWYSSNSKQNQRACVMAIVVDDGSVERWYASFLGQSGWKVGLVKGVAKSTVEELLRQ